MFKPQNKHISEFVLENCNWRQACEWLETAWFPLPKCYEHFDKKRDNRIPLDDVWNHPSYWRRSQVLAQAICNHKLPLDNIHLYRDIQNINDITDHSYERDYITTEIPRLIRNLIASDFQISFNELKRVFPGGGYNIILNDSCLKYKGYSLFIEDKKLMFVSNEVTKKIYDLRKSGVMSEVLTYLIQTAPNQPKSYNDLLQHCPSLNNATSYTGENIRKIPANLIQNISNAKRLNLSNSEKEIIKSFFTYKDGKISVNIEEIP